MMKAFLLLLITLSAHANPGVSWSIYGDDDRIEAARVTPAQKKLADSSAALIIDSFLVKKGNKYKIDAPTLEQQDGVCQKERFRDQPAAALCSGTLIGDDLILTASHCYDNSSICKNASWIFGFEVDPKNRYEISQDEIYRCKEVVFQKFDLTNGNDFAIVRLDRKVKNHSPVKIRQQNSSLPMGTGLFTIGHPRGLPTKVAANGEVLSVENNVMMTNLDSFTGNSGSGVFHSATNELIGVLSYGKEDYDEDQDNVCSFSHIYLLQEGGEAVMGIGPVRDFLKAQQNTRP
ncbi:MAG: trypsin-like serine peptidase [Bacteriovoracaceae bacterium]